MKFLHQNKRFSFQLDEKNAWELPYETETKETECDLICTYIFPNGLKM